MLHLCCLSCLQDTIAGDMSGDITALQVVQDLAPAAAVGTQSIRCCETSISSSAAGKHLSNTSPHRCGTAAAALLYVFYKWSFRINELARMLPQPKFAHPRPEGPAPDTPASLRSNNSPLAAAPAAAAAAAASAGGAAAYGSPGLAAALATSSYACQRHFSSYWQTASISPAPSVPLDAWKSSGEQARLQQQQQQQVTCCCRRHHRRPSAPAADLPTQALYQQA